MGKRPTHSEYRSFPSEVRNILFLSWGLVCNHNSILDPPNNLARDIENLYFIHEKIKAIKFFSTWSSDWKKRLYLDTHTGCMKDAQPTNNVSVMTTIRAWKTHKRFSATLLWEHSILHLREGHSLCPWGGNTCEMWADRGIDKYPRVPSPFPKHGGKRQEFISVLSF